MFRNLGLIVLLSALLLGCQFTGGTKTEEKPATDPPVEKAEEGIKIGDTVVARWTGNSFYEGKVESIDGSKMKVKWNDGSNPSDVDKTDIYEIPKTGAKPEVAVGDMVLAKISTNSYWNGAEISAIEGEVYKVKAIGRSDTTNLDSNKIIKVSAATAANLKDKAGSNDFLKEAQAKKPEAPRDFKPAKGDKVIGQWAGNSWYSGKVNDIKGDKITVAWDDGSKPSEVSMEKVMPDPAKVKSEMPTDNQFVLAKPVSGTKWVFSQVVSVKDPDVEIKDSNGKTRSVKSNEFILLK